MHGAEGFNLHKLSVSSLSLSYSPPFSARFFLPEFNQESVTIKYNPTNFSRKLCSSLTRTAALPTKRIGKTYKIYPEIKESSAKQKIKRKIAPFFKLRPCE
jgi:hypothetical protein